MSFCGRRTYKDADGECHNISGKTVHEIKLLVEGNEKHKENNVKHKNQYITIGQSWCPWSKKQEDSNKEKNNILTIMCDVDKDNNLCNELKSFLNNGYPTNFVCNSKDGNIDIDTCSVVQTGFDPDFGLSENNNDVKTKSDQSCD